MRKGHLDDWSLRAVAKQWLIMLLVIAALLSGAVVTFHALRWIGVRAFPLMLKGSLACLVLCALILFPLSLFRMTRTIAGIGFFLASIMFGVTLWIYSFLISAYFGGYAAVVIGFTLGGVGLIPVGLLLALFHLNLLDVGIILVGLTLTAAGQVISILCIKPLSLRRLRA